MFLASNISISMVQEMKIKMTVPVSTETVRNGNVSSSQKYNQLSIFLCMASPASILRIRSIFIWSPQSRVSANCSHKARAIVKMDFKKDITYKLRIRNIDV